MMLLVLKRSLLLPVILDGGKLSYEDIAVYTELTIEEIEKIASEKKSV